MNLKLKKNYKLCDSNTLAFSNRSTLYVYVFFIFYFEELTGGAKALPDRKESNKSNVDLDALVTKYTEARMRGFCNRYEDDD